MVRWLFATIALTAVALSMSARGRQASNASSTAAGEKGTIGVAMPTKSSERWIKDGDLIKQQLEAEDYQVNLVDANDDSPTQVTQVNDMVTKKNQLLGAVAFDVISKTQGKPSFIGMIINGLTRGEGGGGDDSGAPPAPVEEAEDLEGFRTVDRSHALAMEGTPHHARHHED